MKTNKTAENKKIEQPDIINGLIQNGETINSILSIGWMGKKDDLPLKIKSILLQMYF